MKLFCPGRQIGRSAEFFATRTACRGRPNSVRFFFAYLGRSSLVRKRSTRSTKVPFLILSASQKLHLYRDFTLFLGGRRTAVEHYGATDEGHTRSCGICDRRRLSPRRATKGSRRCRSLARRRTFTRSARQSSRFASQ